jgi:phytoene desaturase
MLRLGTFGRLGTAVRNRFKDPRLHACSVFRPCTPARRLPPLSPSTAVITTIEGICFPEDGNHVVAAMMAQVAEKARVTFRYAEVATEVLRSPTGGWLASAQHLASGSWLTPWFALLIFRPHTSNCLSASDRADLPPSKV